jgi:hypothetical protein
MIFFHQYRLSIAQNRPWNTFPPDEDGEESGDESGDTHTWNIDVHVHVSVNEESGDESGDTHTWNIDVHVHVSVNEESGDESGDTHTWNIDVHVQPAMDIMLVWNPSTLVMPKIYSSCISYINHQHVSVNKSTKAPDESGDGARA